MNKIALLIIYNHRFDKNIPILNTIYATRFSHVYHVVPFYDGNEENVIPVYESSYQFQSYISQAYVHLKKSKYTHFFVVADDMIIAPEIDETNLFEKLGIETDDAYIDELIELQSTSKPWRGLLEAIYYSPSIPGVEIGNILPAPEIAEQRFAQHQLRTDAIKISNISAFANFNLFSSFSSFIKYSFSTCIKKLCMQFKAMLKPEIKLDYPLVGGYSDIVLIPASSMQNFCQYCGAFAASGLFVELAIPTSLVLSCRRIVTNKQIKLKSRIICSEEEGAFLAPYKSDYFNLVSNFPKETLFIHPIKLSKWYKKSI